MELLQHSPVLCSFPYLAYKLTCMIDERFVFLAVAFNFFGSLSYLIDTVKGKIKPNKVTWFLWALAPLVAFAAQISQGVGLSSLLTFMVGFGPLLVFIGSFVNKKAQWKITNFDLICGALSILGLLLWGITRVGNIAILFAILADGLAAIPTLVKSYQAPETENYKVFLLAMIAALITLLTIKQWDFAHFAFPLYIFSICFIFVLLIKFKLGKKLNPKS